MFAIDKMMTRYQEKKKRFRVTTAPSDMVFQEDDYHGPRMKDTLYLQASGDSSNSATEKWEN